ncbi:MAG TPA: cell division protein ZapE [Gammaproteobacteria bacterium]|nr:cell division protein ZapE [Gammaproteobacteria bacterium]
MNSESSQLAMLPVTPARSYEKGLASGAIHTDSYQENAVQMLEQLYQQLVNPVTRNGFFSRWRRKATSHPGGIYLYGGVGRGKTYLMDQFYQSLPFSRKRRVHFHRFMRNVHNRLDRLPHTPDPLPVLASAMAREYKVLCVDEFNVQDIADAMLMSGLLRALVDEGITLLFTSNLKPDELYKGGLQREQFMPAIRLVEQHLLLCNLGTGKDYRRGKLVELKHYHVMDKKSGEAYIKQHLSDFDQSGIQHNSHINISHRQIPVRAFGHDVVWFDFMVLCASARSSSDYLELACEYHMMLLSSVIPLNDEISDIAKRFIHLVDALYDHRVKLLLTAEVSIQNLYKGKRLADEFKRTESRLYEMGGTAYYEQAHKLQF